AREAAESLVVHYDEEPHDTVLAADRPDAHPVDGVMPGVAEKGDLEAELAASAHVVDAEYTTPEEHHSMMEPHAATAHWDGGRLELVDSNQGTTWVHGELT
ncbi:molybdopterin-dependent oxidoreductase, partial [Streptomyces sp. TRM76130]|nr:molybdopterin-dependent oxidoreductase [Streptomyces sp. TRM76130]